MENLTIVCIINITRSQEGDILTISMDALNNKNARDFRIIPYDIFSTSREAMLALQQYLSTRDKKNSNTKGKSVVDDLTKDDSTAKNPDSDKDNQYHFFEKPVPMILINPISTSKMAIEELIGMEITCLDASITISNRYTVNWVFFSITGIMCIYVEVGTTFLVNFRHPELQQAMEAVEIRGDGKAKLLFCHSHSPYDKSRELFIKNIPV
jgi:hypothetical protein